MKKKTIVLSLVPFFALMGCSESATPDRVVVPNPDVEVSVNADGSYSESTANQVNDADKDLADSYREAQAGGYKGSIEEWAKVVALYETDPETAVQNARKDGFDQSDIIFATLAGVAISALAAKAMINNADATTRAYQQQRVNNRTNYAHSQPYDHKAQMAKTQRERERGTAVAGGGSGYGASSTNRNSSYSAMGNNSQSMSNSASKSGGYTSVSRGGFGGAVGRGG